MHKNVVMPNDAQAGRAGIHGIGILLTRQIAESAPSPPARWLDRCFEYAELICLFRPNVVNMRETFQSVNRAALKEKEKPHAMLQAWQLASSPAERGIYVGAQMTSARGQLKMSEEARSQ